MGAETGAPLPGGNRGVRDALAASSERWGRRLAITAPGGDSIEYRDLLTVVDDVAEALAAIGVRPGTRIATVVPDGPRAALSFLAIASRWTCAPLNPAYREGELAFYLGDLDASAVLVASELETPVRTVARRMGIPILEIPPTAAADSTWITRAAGGTDVPVPARGDDVALVLHTSGTTARPKLVPLTHANLLASAGNVIDALELRPEDRCLTMMPLFHIHGIVAGLLSSIVAGAGIACTPGFSAPRFLDWLDELEPTWMTAVPTMYQGLVSRLVTGDRSVTGRLRLLRSSSASLPPSVAEALEGLFGAPVIEAYGMTEAAHQIASNPLPPGRRKPGAVGPPAGPAVAILDPSGNPVDRGERGEVAISGPNVFGGYVANPEANDASFVDGWFRTGDEGYLDEDGYLVLTGRLKEMINRGGEKIAPREVDEVLLQHPAVRQAVAFSVPDERLGEEIAAAVVTDPDATCDEAALQMHVASRLADFKVPRRIVFVDEIPRGPTGKLQRIGLAERLDVTEIRPRSPQPAAAAADPASVRHLAQLAAHVLEVERVRADDDLFDLGLDSMTATDLLARAVQAGLARPGLPTTVFLRHSTPETLAAALERGADPTSGHVVPLRERGSMPPLFVVHGNDGRVVLFRALAERLGEDFPVYVFTLPDDISGLDGVQDLASLYATELRRVHPAGPYAVCGLCFGGAVGLEMARQLSRAGEPPIVLGLINPLGIEQAFAARALGLASYGARRLVHQLRNRTLRRAVRGYVRSRRAGRVEPDVRRIQAELDPMRNAYRASPYDGDALVFATSTYWVREHAWRAAVLGDLDWVRLGGRHGEEMSEPYVSRIAAALASQMRARCCR